MPLQSYRYSSSYRHVVINPTRDPDHISPPPPPTLSFFRSAQMHPNNNNNKIWRNTKKQKNSLSWPAFWHLWQVAHRVDFDPLCQWWPRTTQDHNMPHRPMDSIFGYQIFMIQKAYVKTFFWLPPSHIKIIKPCAAAVLCLLFDICRQILIFVQPLILFL